MSMHSNLHTDNFDSGLSGVLWQAVLTVAGIFGLAALAWAMS